MHKNSSMQLCIKGLTRQRACPERQTAGNTETAINVTHRDVQIEQPPTHKKYEAISEEQRWTEKTRGLKINKIAQLCIPWMSCILPLLPVRPGLKQHHTVTCLCMAFRLTRAS